jgi:glycosyltransferase involved in cell wall biosynthesis
MLETRGHRARKLMVAARDFWRRWSRRHEAERFDGVVVLREASMLGGSIIEDFIARRGIPLIYDFDDPIWLANPDGGGWSTLLLRTPWKIPHICRIADAITVGNEYLAAFARQHNPRVSIVRTSIDLDRFPMLAAEAATEPFTIVWTGSKSTLQYLDMVRPALEEIGSRRAVRLRVICDEAPPPYENVTLDFVRWSPAIEVSSLAAGHVGIMPLPDTPTARGKCACKALQDMAVGRPAVVSPVGFNTQLIRDEENGLLADGRAEWVAQLERMAVDPALRQRLAVAGRRTVENGYSSASSAQAFAEVARTAVGRMSANRSRRTIAVG